MGPLHVGSRWSLLLLLTEGAWAEKPSPAKIEFFGKRIRPVLAQDCYECSRAGEKKKGGLALDHRAAMEEGGDSDDLFDFDHSETSCLIKVLRHEEEDMERPKPSLGVVMERRQLDGVLPVKLTKPGFLIEPFLRRESARFSGWKCLLQEKRF